MAKASIVSPFPTATRSPGESGDEIVPVAGPLQALRGDDEGAERLDDLGRTEHPSVHQTVERALGKDVRQPQRMVEMPVAEEHVRRAGELERAAPDVEGEPRRMDAEPVVVAGARESLDAEVAKSQLDRSHAEPHGPAPAADQISRYSQRRSGCRRLSTLCQSGSMSQRVAATEESSELPSCGVKQKP